MLRLLRRYRPAILIAAVLVAASYLEWSHAHGPREQSYAAAPQSQAAAQSQTADPGVPLPKGLPEPNERAPWPDCPGAFDSKGIPTLKPYARDPRVYGGIYLAVEQVYAPLAKYFFPALQVEDNKNWVRITRTTRNGEKPPDHLTLFGNNQNLRGNVGPVPVILKIDKCTGAVLGMDFDRDKVR